MFKSIRKTQPGFSESLEGSTIRNASKIFMASHHQWDQNAGAAAADAQLAVALNDLDYSVDLFFYDDALPSFIHGTFRQLLFPWFLTFHFVKRNFSYRYQIVETTAGDGYLIKLLIRLLGMKIHFSVRTHGLEHRHAEIDKETALTTKTRLHWWTRLYHYRFRLWEVKQDLKRADTLFFLNEDDARFAIHHLGIKPTKISVVSNGLPPYFLGIVREFRIEHLYKLLFLGSWITRKGSDILPFIIERLFRLNQKFSLTCAGVQVTDDEVLSAFLPEHRSRIRIIRRYGNTELPGILTDHGILIAPSRAEGAQLVIPEAMAGGLVVISSSVGNARQLIDNGKNGFLIEGPSLDGYLKIILELEERPAKANEISKRAMQSVQNCTWQVMARKRMNFWNSQFKPIL